MSDLRVYPPVIKRGENHGKASLMMSFSLMTEGCPHWDHLFWVFPVTQCPGSESRTSPFAESEGQGADNPQEIHMGTMLKTSNLLQGFPVYQCSLKNNGSIQINIVTQLYSSWCDYPLFFHWISPFPWMAKASPFAPKLAWLETPKNSRNSTWKNQPRMARNSLARMVLWSIHQSG